MKSSLSTKFIAELIGTFALVFLGTGAAVVAGNNTAGGLSGLGLLGIALAFGLTVVVMCYAIGNISGCHINPAITIGMLVAGKIKTVDAVAYIVAQLAGAALASFVLMIIMKGLPAFEMGEWALGSTGWGEGYQNGFNTTSAFLTETVMTFLFLFVIFGATSKWGNSTMAGLAIGFTLVVIVLVAIPISGASVNPARSFGPAIFAGGKALSQLWLFFVAPVLGAVIAAFVWMALDKNPQ